MIPRLYKIANNFGIDPMNPGAHNPGLLYVRTINLNIAEAARAQLAKRLALLRRKNALKAKPLLDLGVHKNFDPSTGVFTYDYNSWKNLHNPTGDPNVDRRLDQDWIDTQKARAKYWGAEYKPDTHYMIPIYALGKYRLPKILTKITQDFKYRYSPKRSGTFNDLNLVGRLDADPGTVVHLLGHNLTTAPAHPSGVGTANWLMNLYALGADDANRVEPLKPGTPGKLPDARPFLEKQRIYNNRHRVYPSHLTFEQLLDMQQKDPNITIITTGADPQNYYNSMPEFYTAMRNMKATLAKLGHPYKQATGKLPILRFINAMSSAGLWKNTGITDYRKLAHSPAIHNMYKKIPGNASINSLLRYERDAIREHFNRYIFLLNKPNKTPNLIKLLDRYKQVLSVLIETGKTKPQQNSNYMYG